MKRLLAFAVIEDLDQRFDQVIKDDESNDEREHEHEGHRMIEVYE